ncbi:hypothetical protein BpHYR1_044322 [Brachionus plicatilis]|uniref:Uncharacterized protein n=1 Tax=Brachionus plicatilis TaxID=10195 RepID=A0A3M7T672_BRAPC|nr:hypothetical protein BpHYR1_044322 [Brachionus plicatilis]
MDQNKALVESPMVNDIDLILVLNGVGALVVAEVVVEHKVARLGLCLTVDVEQLQTEHVGYGANAEQKESQIFCVETEAM